jgi:predicted nuclease of predicted toxin-antitoxin system
VRLLFDEQLSEELVTAVRDLFPESLHVRLLSKGGAADPVVWQLAVEQGCVDVTKYEDFHSISVLHGAPPNVVWVRQGNSATADIARLLRDQAADLRGLEAQVVINHVVLG